MAQGCSVKRLITSLVPAGATYAAGNIAQTAIAVILLPLYTSRLSARELGGLALITVAASLFSIAAASPVCYAYDRFCYKPDYQERAGVLLLNLYAFLLLKSLVLAFCYLALSDRIASHVLSDVSLVPAVKLYALVLLLSPSSSFLLVFLRLQRRARLYVVLTLSRIVVTTGLIVYLLVWHGLGVYAIIVGTVFGHAYTCLMVAPVLLKSLQWQPSLSVLREPLRYGYPLLVSGYSNLLIRSADRYVLSLFGTMSTVGVYSVCYRVGSLLNPVLIEPSKHAVRPVVLELEKAPKQQQRFLSLTATYYYVLAVFCWLALSLFAKEIVMLLLRRSEFWHGYVLLPLVGFSSVLQGLGNFLAVGMVMKNKPFYISLCLLISVAVNLCLNFLLIPFWGIVGAAAATLCAYLTWNVLKAFFSFRFYQLRFDLKRLLHVTAVGLVLLAPGWLLPDMPKWWTGLAIKGLLLFLYPVLLLGTGFLSSAEREGLSLFGQDVRERGIADALQRLLT